MILADRISAILPSWFERVNRLKKNYGFYKVGDVTVEQIYMGIRGVTIQISDISYVDPNEGVRLRGYTIPELLTMLPKAKNSEMPLVGGLYYVLMVDKLPTEEEALSVEDEWKKRNKVPDYVFHIIDSMPMDTHPMTLFSQAILAMQHDSLFSQKYSDGLPKSEYWKYYLEDSLNLTARTPIIAAHIYNRKYRNGDYIEPDNSLDWAANFAHMIGKGDDPEYLDLARLFFFLHSDHEGGNVSAHASALVCSSLSDIYYTCSAGMNGLAGPLHGLANQECLRWLLDLRDSFDHFPSKDEVRAYIEMELKSGHVIPGYGHAVLRIPDPRFTAQLEFGFKHCPDDELFKLVNLVYEVAPPVMSELGKIKNPWPNVDAINGTLQYHYGVQQFDFYTVLFGVSRILGLTSHAVWARALGKPIERPKSLTTKMLEEMVAKVEYLDSTQ